jgi:hypothetical protein
LRVATGVWYTVRMTDPAHPLLVRLANRIKTALVDEGANPDDVTIDPDVETTTGADSVYVGGDVTGIPISVYVGVVPQ